MDKIMEMKMTLENYVAAQICGNLEQCDTKELGEAVDMIKDLAEAAYYCKATEAMEGAGEELEQYDRMGYNTSRYGNGHYAPKGRGHYSNTGHTMGYMPMEKEYLDEYIREPVRFRERMGYHGEMPYNNPDSDHSRYGHSYDDWKRSRRNYTETHNPTDKAAMASHTNEHITDTITTIKEMWADADPTLRNEMKMRMQQLLNDMK